MTKRLKILSSVEIKRYYEIPSFSMEDQKHYFALDAHEENILNELRTYSGKIYFILQLGYFKANQQLFRLNKFNVTNDINYIKTQYFSQLKQEHGINIGNDLRFALQNRILSSLDYRLCSAEIKQKLQVLATEIVSIDSSPSFIFKEMVHFLQKQRIVLPGYTFFQDLIGTTITNEEKRLSSLLKDSITPEIQKMLDSLLQADSSLHELTHLKKELKNFGHKQVKGEIKKLEQITPLYKFAKQILPKLKISIASIKYYASLIDYYNVYKLKRMGRDKVVIYLFCFIFYRYRKTIDHLVECFIYNVNSYTTTAKNKANEASLEQQSNHAGKLRKAAKVLEIFTIDKLDKCLFSEVKLKIYEFLPHEQLVLLAQYLKDQKIDRTQREWEYYVDISKIFKRNLRPLLVNLDFAENNSTHKLIPVIDFLSKEIKSNGNILKTHKKDFMLNLVPASIRRYLYDKTDDGKQINLHKYEFMAYQQIKNAIDSGSLFVPESNKYRSLEEDLIDESFWQNNPSILQNLGLEKLLCPVEEVLAKLEAELDYWLARVNARIKNGENQYVKLTGKGKNAKWSLPYAKLEETYKSPIFSQIPQISIADILMDNNKQCGFLDCFTPITLRYSKSKADNESLVASLVALGTYIGLGKMGEISDIDYNHLFSTTNSLIRLETLRNANDQISNAIAKLPICKYYNIMDDILHASADGSKIETQIETVNARHSPKYFGLGKGHYNNDVGNKSYPS